MDGKSVRDADLVARAKTGDLDALDRLVVRHRVRLFHRAREVVDDAEAAQDIVQDALLRAYQALGALRDGERFGAWASVIVRRVAQGWVRDGRHRREAPLDTGAVAGVFTGGWFPPTPPTEAQERIRDALAVLTQRERQVMILHYLEGRTCEEIAAQLRVSAGTVKSILHHSRRKVRKEVRAMTGEERRRARGLRFWINGSVPPWRGNVFDHMRPLLAQSVTLSVNRQERTVAEIADEVGADREYVEETAEDLLEMDVLICPRKGKYLANFIALDAEGWRRLAKLVKQPAAEAARRLGAGEGALRKAFGGTALAASGWEWEEMAWPVYSVLVANFGARRHEPDCYDVPLPQRPQGGQYLMGGYEKLPGLPLVWLTGFNSYLSSRDLNIGCFWTYGLERTEPEAFRASDAVEAFLVFAEGPLTEKEALARLDGGGERWRGVLASLVHEGMLRRIGGQLRAGIPLLTRRDGDALAPAIGAVMRPVITELIVPTLAQVPSLLDEMGYGHWRDQYPQWQRWLSGNTMGEAVRFLTEQGILPRPSDPAPASFASVAWQGQLPF